MSKSLLSSQSTLKPAEPVKFSRYLSGDVALRIHTRKAQSLCQGSWESHDMGMFQFASVMTHIFQARQQDDPYADWIIQKIEKELESIHKAIEQLITEYEQALQQYRGLEVAVFGSRHPLKLLLEFATPLGYMAARTIANLDYLLRQTYTFKRLGILPESQETVSRLFWMVKTALSNCRKWHHTGVTRQNVRDQNPKAQRAETKMGKLPKHILNKQEKRSEKKSTAIPKKT